MNVPRKRKQKLKSVLNLQIWLNLYIKQNVDFKNTLKNEWQLKKHDRVGYGAEQHISFIEKKQGW